MTKIKKRDSQYSRLKIRESVAHI